tara:strand:- start:66 stop:203 length:138 start_codon:yes stop_codon:yes gene_type:complete
METQNKKIGWKDLKWYLKIAIIYSLVQVILLIVYFFIGFIEGGSI